ncbi:MAG: hypothetical protein QNK23_12110 [Crocinitomicaceae bacterium]|nr:hypothetical protein [Crocinitomicaceae bacterium]
MNWIKSYSVYFVLCIYAVLALLTIVSFRGTGDAGDSILHFLFAKSAPDHPELFFNHWAKPVFVFLASPFAQLGFLGMKLFNVLVMMFTILLTYRVAERLELKNSIVTAFVIICSPLVFTLTFSGLTEPLFALFSILGLYLIVKEKLLLSCIVISFLPFIRSEGLIILSVFGLYLLYKKEWKMIPWLIFGHLAYSLAGAYSHGDLFWVITKIPYANAGSPYGSGGLFHFVEQLLYVIGIPIYILFAIGVLTLFWRLIRKQFQAELHILVLMGFGVFFVAHSLFWYLGIFNSMGLNRVLIGVIPFIAIISLVGFNTLTEDLLKNKNTPRRIVQAVLVVLVVVFPFTSNPAAIQWDRDLSLSQDQEVAIEAGNYTYYHLGADHRFIYVHPYLSEILNVDHFDPEQRVELSIEVLNSLQTGDVIIWENWFSVVERGVTKESLDAHPQLEFISSFSGEDRGRIIEYAVYQVPE